MKGFRFAITLLLVWFAGCEFPASQSTRIQFVIGVSHANLSEPWRVTMNREILDEAAKFPYVRLIVLDAGDSIRRQVKDVQTLLQSGIDLLILSPTDAQALTPAVGEAYARIPVILLDRAVEGYDYTLFLGPDNDVIGRQAGAYVARALEKKGGKVVEVQGRWGSPPVIDRSQGFHDILDPLKNVDIVEASGADWIRDKAEDLLSSQLQRLGRVDFIVAQNDAMALGAWKAARKLGRTGIRFVGVDGLPGKDGGLDLVRRGILEATFQSPTGGREAVDYALDILHKVPGSPKKIFLRSRLVTKANVDVPPVKPRWSPESGRKIVLGYAQTGDESYWRTANTLSIKNAAARAGIDLIFRNAELKQANQIAAIREFIRRKVDVIAFSPLVETGWDAVLAEAKAAGIPVICSDRTVNTKQPDLYSTFLGGDFVEEGRRAARWLKAKMEEKALVNVVELRGTEGSAPAIDRRKGFEEIMRTMPGYRLLDSADGDFRESEGKRVMKKFLEIYGRSIQAVFAQNDDMALGAIEAVKEYGLSPGKDVLIVSIDGVRAAFEEMVKGELNCSVECTPLLGPQLMKAVKDYASGKDLPLRIITAEGIFPQETAAAALPLRKY